MTTAISKLSVIFTSLFVLIFAAKLDYLVSEMKILKICVVILLLPFCLKWHDIAPTTQTLLLSVV